MVVTTRLLGYAFLGKVTFKVKLSLTPRIGKQKLYREKVVLDGEV
jgi:hypothetical protein